MSCNALQARLNERNVVELINKLQQLGLLGDDLLHTINGREYVTPEHLRKEVIEAIDQAGGRIALVSGCPCHDSECRASFVCAASAEHLAPACDVFLPVQLSPGPQQPIGVLLRMYS